jgi:hypothetical protein
MKPVRAFLLLAALSFIGLSQTKAEQLSVSVSSVVAMTLIANIHNFGPAKVHTLRQAPGVLWSIEFGDELLLGIGPLDLARFRAMPNMREGVGAVAPNELLLREHACLDEARVPAIGVVGGYELIRQPPALVRYAKARGAKWRTVPADGVVSYAVRNRSTAKHIKAAEPGVQAIVARVSGSRWRESLLSLSSFQRNTFNPQLSQAHDWILAQFQQTGLSTSSFSYSLAASAACPGSAPITLANPIAEKRGSVRPNEWIVIGAHYDSRNINRCEVSGIQPGANDNASGCAAVMELARVFANVPTDRSLRFICFSGEEQGLLGSYRYVQALSAAGELGRVKLMINLDMIAHDPSATFKARIETTPEFQTLYPLFASAAVDYAPELNLIQATGTQAYSDHWPFIASGVPSIFTWEDGAAIYPQYHTAQDTFANMSNAEGLAQGVMRMDAAVIAQQVGLLSDFFDGFE